jgi:alkylation response protein AidB-like acyl-CoA dehydrogenase
MVQEKLAQMYTNLNAARSFVHQTARAADAGAAVVDGQTDRQTDSAADAAVASLGVLGRGTRSFVC